MVIKRFSVIIIMLKVFTLILVFGCLLQSSAFAADPAFIVFYNSGKATKKTAEQAVVLKKGDHLSSSDVLIVPTKTQVVLVCANFTAIQLKTEGTTPVAKLLEQCKTKAASASSAYFKYVWDQFSHAHKAPEKDPRAYMKNYGAVSRGHFLRTTVNTDTIYYESGQLALGWKPEEATRIAFFDSNERSLFDTQNSRKLRVDSVAKILKFPGVYLWRFKGQNLKWKALVLLKKTEYDQHRKTILANVIETSPAETAYLTAYLFEEKHFLADAAKYYEKASKLAPDNQIYKDAYAKFGP